MKPYVVYWNNMPSPYMVERFNSVVHRGNLDFEAWFSTRIAEDRSWRVDEGRWEFRYRYLPSIGHGEHPLAIATPLFRRRAPDLVVSLYASSAFLVGWSLARIRGARTAFWAEVTFDTWVKRQRWKETLKSSVLPRADAILTAGSDGSAYVKRYGVPDSQIYVVPHVIDASYYEIRSRIASSEREAVRERLGLRGVTFIYVGRLWWGKGLDYLIDAFASLQRSAPHEVSLLVVGDGPDEDLLKKRCQDEGLGGVVFAGFHHADTLPQLYAAADVFVFPTLGDPFGMVIPEAMACGLPVISSSAAGELRDRVIDGVNGFIVPAADSGALSARMAELAGDPDLRHKMAKAAATTVAGQSPDLWAAAFEEAVTGILHRPLDAR